MNESEHVQQISGLETFGNPVPECQGGYRCSPELIAGLPAVVSNEKTFSDFLAPTNMCPITPKGDNPKAEFESAVSRHFPARLQAADGTSSDRCAVFRRE